jgi:hypothetical protein
MIVPTSKLFKLAYGKYAIGAYNINNMEQRFANRSYCCSPPLFGILLSVPEKGGENRILCESYTLQGTFHPERHNLHAGGAEIYA